MEMIKKWAGCVVSFIAGVLALALSACSGMVATTTIQGTSSSTITKAFKVITDAELLTDAKNLGIEGKFLTMKVFSIIMLVLAVLLIVYAIVMLLKNVNVIKSDSKIFAIAGIVLAILFLIATIGVVVSSNVYAGAMETAMAPLVEALTYGMGSLAVKIGVYQPIMLGAGIVTAATVAACEIQNVR